MAESETPTPPTDSADLSVLEALDAPEDWEAGIVPDEDETPSTLESGAASAELPEDYTPYSQFPWTRLPDDVRGEFLGKLKAFHGDMTRGQQDVAQLRQELQELRPKADLLVRLSQDPAFREWYQSRQTVPAQPTQPVPGTTQAVNPLKEYLGDEGSAAIQQVIQTEIRRALGPVQQQLRYSQQQSISQQTERELETLRQSVRSRNWPDVERYMPAMVEAVNQGRARTVEDAYRAVAWDDIVKSERDHATQEFRQQLTGKASTTIAPRVGPGGQAASVEQYDGPDGTERALADALREQLGG